MKTTRRKALHFVFIRSLRQFQRAWCKLERRSMPPLPLYQRIIVLFTIGCVLGTAIAALVSLVTKIPWDRLNEIFIDLLIFLLSL